MRQEDDKEEDVTQTAETTRVRSQRGTVLVDLSLEISNGMPAHALFPSPIVLPYVTHEQAKSAGLGTPEDAFTYSVDPALEASDEGPLAGVPFAMKEVAPHLQGQVSQLGSRWPGDGVTGAADTHFGRRIRAVGCASSLEPGRPSSPSTPPRSPSHTGPPATRGISSEASAARAAARRRSSRRGRSRSPTRRTAAARFASRPRSAGSSA